MHTQNVKTAASESTGRWGKELHGLLTAGTTTLPVHRRPMSTTATNTHVLMHVCISSVAHCLKCLRKPEFVS